MPEEIKDIYEKIEQGIDDFFQSDRFLSYLQTMSRFHNYSARNILLIRQQMPSATKVAGYKTWQEVGRQVNAGEKGIRILCPKVTYVEVETEETDENGKNIIERQPVTRFIPVSVFDVSQTTGRELPALATELTGDVPGFDRLFAAITGISEYRIVTDDIGETAKGLCDHAIRTIFIRSGMSQAQTLKTAVHELFHSRMHGDIFDDKPRSQKEIEAESAAYVVCSHFGLDTSDYSFGYVASWAAGTDHSTRRSCIRNIHKEVKLVIGEMEQALERGREAGGATLQDIKERLQEKAAETFKTAGIEKEDIAVHIYDVKPAEKKEVFMYLANPYYEYRGALKVTGLTKTELQTSLAAGAGHFDNIIGYITGLGGGCELLEPREDMPYGLSYDLGNDIVYDLSPSPVTSVAAMVEYDGDMREDEAFAALNGEEQAVDGVKADLNPVKREELKEPYTERLEKYENEGYSAVWPMVGITYSNVEGMPLHNMNISEAVRFINRLDEEVAGDPGKYMRISISYTYNDWNYEHVQNLDFGKGRMNFIDYLKLPPNIIRHLKSHSSLIDMTAKAESFAPDTTYGREYGDRMQEWAEYCRMELNHNSDEPVIPKPPLLDELYHTSELRQDFRLDR